MLELNTKYKLTFSNNRQLFTHYVLILIVSFLISAIISQIFGVKRYYIVSIISEFTCIFIAIAIFLITWSTYEEKINRNYLIGFGFLAVVVFDSFHLYYFFSAKVFNSNYIGLPMRYSMLGKLAEVLVLLIVSLRLKKFQLNKWIGLLVTILFSIGISVVVLYSFEILPIIKTREGINTVKLTLRYIIIVFAIISIYNLQKNPENKSIASYRYILIVMLIIIFREVTLMLLRNYQSFSVVYGNVLEMVYYYYLYKAVFTSSVTYKQNRIENENVQLKNLQFQTQIILNAMERLVMIVDKDNRILMCNKRYEEVIGVSANEIIGMDYFKLFKNIKMHLEREYEKNDSSDNRNKNFELSFTNTYGELKRLLYDVSVIYNAHGEMIGKIGVASDITNLREQQEKMIQQEKLALLGQMGAGIVHETRNYLTTIKGSCQLIDILTEDAKIKNYTNKIDKDINEVNRIISEFLSLSKPREVQLEEVSIYDIVQSIKVIVETSSLLKGININFYLSKDEQYLLCDESQIKQVVLNICKNAVDAMVNTEDAKLVIETGYIEDTDEMFIKIEDNGEGMSKETLKKIGTPFFTTKKTGTGLGLNVCNTIIKEHKGKIDVDSQLGKGTTFIITLPCIKDDEEFEDAM